MADITAKQVKELRDATNVGMMECKKALVESEGDMERAIRILRERGVAIAAKKSTRTANQGVIVAAVNPENTVGALIEVNCETDFVARNEGFKEFVAKLAEQALGVDDNQLAEVANQDVTAKIAEIGENIIVKRNIRFECSDQGMIATYIHLGSKVGVILEMGCASQETAATAEFKELAKNITLQIAAVAPRFLSRQEVPEDVLKSERDVYAKQVAGKPENIIDKIVDGKLNKFYADNCLVEQAFIKDDSLAISDLIEKTGKSIGDTIAIRRFRHWQLGE